MSGDYKAERLSLSGVVAYDSTLNEVSDAIEDFRSFLTRCLRPDGKRLTSSLIGVVDIFLVRVGDQRIDLAGGGIKIVQPTSSDSVHELTAYKIGNLEDFRHVDSASAAQREAQRLRPVPFG